MNRHAFTRPFFRTNRVWIVFCLSCFLAGSSHQARDFQVRSFQDISAVLSLDNGPATEDAYTWWARLDGIDPVQISGSIQTRIDAGGGGDRPGPGWHPVTVPGFLNDLPGYTSEKRSAWFLRTIQLPPNLSRSLSIRLGKIDDRDVAYFNGVEIGRSGQWDSELAEAFDLIRIYDIPPELVRPGKTNVLLVHVQGYTLDAWGMTRGSTAIGPAREMHTEQVTNRYREVLFLIVYATVGGYFLFLFVRRRVERENLFFAIFALSLVGYQFVKSPFRWDLGMSFVATKRLEYYLLYLLAPAFYFFLRYYFEFPKNRFMRWWDRVLPAVFLVHVAAVIVCTFTDNASLWWEIQRRVQVLWLFLIIAFLGMLIYQARRKQVDAWYMIAGFLVLSGGILIDMASAQGLINLPSVTSYTFFGFVSSMALILVNRFVRVSEEVEDLNQNLERKVHQRTEQLNRSLSDVRALKVQQDGDYFLTSLLIGPLGGNFASSRTLSLELLVSQKKQFQFRKWEAEIGGDLCALYDVVLRGRKYTVILNGDAMGKSIQGAGGALVLGTVFKSVITRTQMSRAAREKYPEQWLKECFLELQNVFIAFDGYMLVSAIIGLLDDANGMLYYINAEHPGIVLYRDGDAAFLPEERILRKFGIDDRYMDDQGWTLSTFRLRPGDVLYIGSDGRDDLDMGKDRDGKRVMNEDEYLFVRLVSEHPASLDELHASLLEAGAQTDDLSLIRVGYLEDPPFEETVIPAEYSVHRERALALGQEERMAEAIEDLERAVAIRDEVADDVLLLARLHRREKNYARAAELYTRLTQLEPMDTRYLYEASMMLKLARDFDAAADFGERCRLRDPENLKNLLNLADVYRGLKNYDRSEAMLGRVLKREPENPEAQLIKQALENRGS